jgi:putative transposase
VEHVAAKLGVSERFACKVLGQHRSTQRKVPRTADDEVALTAAIIDWARQYGRYGYRRVTALLRVEGWRVNHKRVERIWRREGLKVPARQPSAGGYG